METVKINESTTAIQFFDSNGYRQTIKVVADNEGKNIVLPENWLTVADVEIWMQAIQLAKTVAS